MSAGEITQIMPSLKVPEVPTGPRAHPNSDLAQGIMDLARGLDRVAAAQSQFTGRARAARDAAAAQDSTDFEGVRRGYQQDVDAARNEIGNKLQSPDERQQFARTADAIGAAYGDHVSATAFDKAQQLMLERLGGELSGLARDAAHAGVGGVHLTLRKVASDSIERLVRAGVLDRNMAHDYLAGFDSAVDENRLRSLAAVNPERARMLLDGDGGASLLPDRRQALRDEFATASAWHTADREARLKTLIGDLGRSLQGGARPPVEMLDELSNIAAATQNPDAAKAVAAARAGVGFAERLGRMPPEDAAAMLARLDKEAPASPEKDAALAYGQGMLRDMTRELARDPLSFAAAQGILDPPAIDWQQVTPEDLQVRAREAQAVTQFYRLDKSSYVTESERAGLGQALKAADPDRKMALMSAVRQALGPEAAGLFASVGETAPAEAHLAALATFGNGREEVARRGFRGARAIADKAVSLPPEWDLGRVENAQIGTIFDARQSAARSQVIAAARALYAERAVSKGLADFDPVEYGRALHQAMGMTETGGGVAVRNGRRYILPMEMTQQAMDLALERMTPDDLKAWSGTGGQPVHVTLSGEVVPAKPEDVRGAVLVQSGYGRYRVSMTDPDRGAPQYLVDDKTGSYWELSLADPARQPRFAAVAVPAGRFHDSQQRLERVPAPPKDQSRVPAGDPAQTGQKAFYDRLPQEQADAADELLRRKLYYDRVPSQ